MTNLFINFNLSVKTTSFKEPNYKGPKGGHKDGGSVYACHKA